MQELIEFLVKSIVEDKDAVNIQMSKEDNCTLYTVKVSSNDIGHVIGKGGNVAQSIRTIVKSVNPRQRVRIKFDTI